MRTRILHHQRPLICGTIALLLSAGSLSESAAADDKVILQNKKSRLAVAVAGGGIVEFRLLKQEINPLNWEISPQLEERPAGKPYLRGHFLCLDRWGAPSAAEAENGMPFHGEAPRRVWAVTRRPTETATGQFAEMQCRLPLAGLLVKRRIQLAGDTALFSVSEDVTNTGKLGRIYNMVQHPTIAPPFLSGATLVDTNAAWGFSQSGPVPDSRTSAFRWPVARLGDRSDDLRRYRHAETGVTDHDVTSFTFDDSVKYGWVTAANPEQKLLIGYLWKTADYPWLNIWRYREERRVTARGLEFGTTGYHRPFGALVEQGRILQRPLYVYIDAAETVGRRYYCFLANIPDDFQGVGDVFVGSGELKLIERQKENPRTINLGAEVLSAAGAGENSPTP